MPFEKVGVDPSVAPVTDDQMEEIHRLGGDPTSVFTVKEAEDLISELRDAK